MGGSLDEWVGHTDAESDLGTAYLMDQYRLLVVSHQSRAHDGLTGFHVELV